MKTFKVKIKGTTPLLHHRMPEEELFGLLGAKTSRKKDKEELTPREIADKYAYKSDSGSYYIPAEYLAGAFTHVASDYKQKNSTRKSLKTIAKGIFRPNADKFMLQDENGAELTSFEVDVRKATNHQKGAVAVCRPRFDRWEVEASVMIDDNLVHPDTVLEILNDAGKRSGMGSFRVSRGGYFGQFIVTEFQES
jgi:hypothetical protein